MLHHPHPLPHPNRLPQQRTFPHLNHTPATHPYPFSEPTAFTSQLDEIDHLLRAFRLQRQRQRQNIYQWVPPADEDTDERLLDSESDEESGRRWSESTESKSAGGGGGVVSGTWGLEDAGSLARGDGARLGRGWGTGQGGREDLGLGFGLVGSNHPDVDVANASKMWVLRDEPPSVRHAMCEERKPDIGALSQPVGSQGNASSKSGTATELYSEKSESGCAPVHFSGLETARGNAEPVTVRRVTFDLPLDDEEDDEKDDKDTKERR